MLLAAPRPFLWSAMQPAAADPSEESTQHIPAPRTSAPDAAAPAPPAPSTSAPSTSADKSEISAQTSESAGLTERELAILAFEGRWWKHAGAKEQAIRDTFGLSSTRYYQVLNALLDKPEATEQEPVLVGRLRRLRATRARTRRR
jgi:Protein of unknown function (DUF3263)